MNINNNVDFCSGSGNMNERNQQENERCPVTFRAMNEHRTNESNKDFKRCTPQNINFDAEDMKVQPYQYTKPSCRTGEEHHEMTVQRRCTGDLQIVPLSTSTSVVQTHVEHYQYTERQIEPIFHRNLLEVGSDLVPISGVEETSLAHKKGHTIDTACKECNTVLFCLETASMVVCPSCRCVSPLESYSKKQSIPTVDVHAGIGLPIDFVIALE